MALKKNTIKYLQDLLLAARIAKNSMKMNEYTVAVEKFKGSLCALLAEEAITKDEHTVWMRMLKKV